MNQAQRYLLPLILVGMALVVGLTRLLAEPDRAVLAAVESQAQPAVQPEPAAEAGEPTDCPIASAYPAEVLTWCADISAAALTYGLDANLIAAVILQESGGNAAAYSRSGAVGLMQVMPRDGLAAEFMCINGPCFSARPSMDELYNPQFNIDYGSKMLAGLINRHGEVREALRAYGPMDIGYRYADTVLSIYQNYQ